MSLRCNVTNDEDAVNPLTIAWYNPSGKKLETVFNHLLLHNTTDPRTGEVQSVLLFDPVDHMDSGEYTCHAFNDKNCYTEAKVMLIVECKDTVLLG